jgi:glutamyl-tRNA synthetase
VYLGGASDFLRQRQNRISRTSDHLQFRRRTIFAPKGSGCKMPHVPMEKLVEEWRARAEHLTALNLKQIEGPMGELDSHLTLRSYIVGHSLTEADTAVWRTLRDNRVAYAYIKQGLMVNLSRWFRFVEETNPSFALPHHPAKPAKAVEEHAANKDEGANYDIGLQDTSKGVVTRFPPEPS